MHESSRLYRLGVDFDGDTVHDDTFCYRFFTCKTNISRHFAAKVREKAFSKKLEVTSSNVVGPPPAPSEESSSARPPEPPRASRGGARGQGWPVQFSTRNLTERRDGKDPLSGQAAKVLSNCSNEVSRSMWIAHSFEESFLRHVMVRSESCGAAREEATTSSIYCEAEKLCEVIKAVHQRYVHERNREPLRTVRIATEGPGIIECAFQVKMSKVKERGITPIEG